VADAVIEAEEVIRQYVRKQGSDKTYKKLHRQDVQMELF